MVIGFPKKDWIPQKKMGMSEVIVDLLDRQSPGFKKAFIGMPGFKKAVQVIYLFR